MEEHHPYGGVFQQENVAAYEDNKTNEWFDEGDIVLLLWPAKSSPCNVIENLRDILVRKVYAGNRQFDYVDNLKEAIVATWDIEGNRASWRPFQLLISLLESCFCAVALYLFIRTEFLI